MMVDKCHNWIMLFLMLSSILLYARVDGQELTSHTDIILIGGMGDLSKKYLLNGFFRLISKHHSDTESFSFYPSGRTSPESTEPTLDTILNKTIVCENEDSECLDSKNEFLKLTRYTKLKNNDDYANFCEKLKLKWKNYTLEESQTKKITVIFYLSIPSSGYLSTAEFINKNCRFSHKHWSLKVVLEKPFGSDRKSAQQMSMELSDSFSEDEIYRVDHYLGKTIAREIVTFRQQNPDIESLLTQDHVDHIEIFMKETIGAKGRIEFYDQTGVIKDVMQNHLTELLVLVTMNVKADPMSTMQIKEEKLRLLRQIEPVRMAGTIRAQYSEYLSEAEQEKANLEMSKFTPTFAASRLNILSPRWNGVPMILVAGKHLNERSSFVRVVFKRNTLCLTKCQNNDLKQLVFHIGHGSVGAPAIVVSKSLGSPIWPKGFKVINPAALPAELYEQNTEDLNLAVPSKDTDAYTGLIDDLYHSLCDRFVGSEHLLALWDIWSNVAGSSHTLPILYEKGDPDGNLTFTYTSEKLSFDRRNVEAVPIAPADPTGVMSHSQSSFLGYKLITTSKSELVYLLAKDIVDSITENLKTKLSFHLALSGGQSPLLLFDTLVQYFPEVPWMHVHIWQVDERCVPATDKDSNFRYLDRRLLQFISIPYINIHPMPVDITGKLCSPEDRGSRLYQEEMKNLISPGGFDYIVLGLGTDGHTASIFPGSQTLKESRKLAVLSDNSGPKQRMTLTLPAINSAVRVSVLVTGSGKREIVGNLEEKGQAADDYPILGVQPESGDFKWFIDEAAMIDES